MDRRQALIAVLVVALSCAPCTASADHSGRSTSTSSTSAAKYRAAAELYRGALDLRELQLRVCREHESTQDTELVAWRAAAENGSPATDDGSTPSWVWPTIAGIAAALFAAGFYLRGAVRD